MRILLDTHILLWWLADDRRLPDAMRDAVADGSNAVYVSAISMAEIAIKGSLGKFESPGDLAAVIANVGTVTSAVHCRTRGPPFRGTAAIPSTAY